MVGPPGSGKTLLARTVPSILPPLGLNEALEVTRLYSVSGMLSADRPLITSRLFRAPHHTTSHAGLVGGGRWPRPGEISLAHRGVFFLEVLRQPLTSCSASRYTANDLLIYPWMPPTRHYVTMLRMPGDAGGTSFPTWHRQQLLTYNARSCSQKHQQRSAEPGENIAIAPTTTHPTPAPHSFPPGIPLVGKLPQFRRDPLAFIEGVHRTYGPTATIHLLNRQPLTFSPEHAYYILVEHANTFGVGVRPILRVGVGASLLTTDGAHHRQWVEGYAEIMTIQTADMVRRWHVGDELDVAAKLREVTLRIIIQVLFDLDLAEERTQLSHLIDLGIFIRKTIVKQQGPDCAIVTKR